MSGLNYLKLGSTLSNICYSTQLDDATKCHYAFKNFWGEPWKRIDVINFISVKLYDTERKMEFHFTLKKNNLNEVLSM